MTMSIEELYDRVLALSSNVEDTFLELGRSLRQLWRTNCSACCWPPSRLWCSWTNLTNLVEIEPATRTFCRGSSRPRCFPDSPPSTRNGKSFLACH
jgi:hypothetical protein